MPDTSSRDENILSELTELSLAAVRKAHERLMAAEDDDAVDRATRNFERLSRGLRHTLALKARFQREERRASREERAQAIQEKLGDLKLRRQRLHVAVGYEIEREHEGDEATALHWELGELLDAEELSEAFTTEDFAAQVARIKMGLGFTSPVAAATAGEGPPAERSQERVVEGANRLNGANNSPVDPPTPPLAPTTTPSTGRGPPPATASGVGEVRPRGSPDGEATGWLSG